MYRIIISNFQDQQLISLKNLLLPLLLNGQVSVGEVAMSYEMKEEILCRVVEGNVEYKKG
ncbi:hypothetical protein [Flavobacterium sp. HNIBRBA15423]|uniref:hypothetical protein n=1 Tax=Flavobacterium sp. HNIBRBA15423 TaxID=3458683 RepID=UPI004044E09E